VGWRSSLRPPLARIQGGKQSVQCEIPLTSPVDRFHDIAWGRITNDHRWGVIAGALENGALDLWDADALLKGSKYVEGLHTDSNSDRLQRFFHVEDNQA
jgi:hypothetical protein